MLPESILLEHFKQFGIVKYAFDAKEGQAILLLTSQKMADKAVYFKHDTVDALKTIQVGNT